MSFDFFFRASQKNTLATKAQRKNYPETESFCDAYRVAKHRLLMLLLLGVGWRNENRNALCWQRNQTDLSSFFFLAAQRYGLHVLGNLTSKQEFSIN